jgi:alpha-1,2-mannosyltransferase
VVAYVHYPTISTNMLTKVRKGQADFNNDAQIAKNSTLSSLKYVYYQLFAVLYAFSGRYAHVAMVNSSWTREHILQIWKPKIPVPLVYPPCDTDRLSKFPLGKRSPIVLSIAQYRPEKAHLLQLEVFRVLLDTQEKMMKNWQLILIGSSRNREDALRAKKLREYCRVFGLQVFHFYISFLEPYSSAGKCEL